MTSHKPPEPNKTLVGVPGDFQAAVDKLRAQQGDDPLRRTRLGQPIPGQASNAPASHAPPPLPVSRGFQQPPPGFQPAPPAPAAPPLGRLPSAEKTLIGMPGNLQEVLRAAEAARSRTRERAGEPRTAPHGTGSLEQPRVHLHLDESEDGSPVAGHAAGMGGTRDRLGGRGPRPEHEDDDDATDLMRPRLALSERTTTRTVAPSKKLWPALALLGAVLLIGGGSFAWRSLRAGSAARPAVASPAPQSVPALPAAPSTDVSAATQADAVAPPRAASPAPELQGSVADLEQRAVDLLIAKDYPAASRVYERLRALAPEHKEYAVMFGLLTRTAAVSCGQPGQQPCAR